MPGPRVLVVEHEADCPPALFGGWLEDAGCTVTVSRPYVGDELPPLEEYDALLVLGGPMAATDPHPWLAPLRDLIRDAAAARIRSRNGASHGCGSVAAIGPPSTSRASYSTRGGSSSPE